MTLQPLRTITTLVLARNLSETKARQLSHDFWAFVPMLLDRIVIDRIHTKETPERASAEQKLGFGGLSEEHYAPVMLDPNPFFYHLAVQLPQQRDGRRAIKWLGPRSW